MGLIRPKLKSPCFNPFNEHNRQTYQPFPDRKPSKKVSWVRPKSWRYRLEHMAVWSGVIFEVIAPFKSQAKCF